MSWVFAAGLILLTVAAAADLLGLPHPGRGWLSGLPYLFGATGCGCLAAAGGAALAGNAVRLNVAGLLGQAIPGQRTLGLSADRLSGLFLVMAFGAAFPISVAFASWAARPGTVGRRGLGASYALAVGSVAVIVTATDAFTLLFAWEALTLAFYLLAGLRRHRSETASAAQITFAFGKISGAALLAGLLLLAATSHSIRLASFAHVPPGAARSTALVLLLAGFAVKVGLVPFQVWLPRGYTSAPGPARAIMAGVAVNVGFYGMWRTLSLLGRPPGWLAAVLLLLAAFTALLGIAHAAVQNRLPRVIAYSSVENSGLIIVGFGVALVGSAVRDQRLIAAGLLAATLQMIAHTAAKSLLFTASAGLEETAGSDDLEALRGMGRRAPWSGTGLAIGSLTLAGLPPTAGFVSEWFLLESLMQQFRVPGLGFRLVLALAGAAVALTAGFAGVTFVRLVGLVVLGRGPSAKETRHGWSDDYGWAGRLALVLLSIYPLAIAALSPLEIRLIARGLSPVVPATLTSGALKSPWVLQPVFAGFSILSPSWLWIDIPVLVLLVGLFAWAVSGRRLLRVRRVPAWRSATIGVQGPDSYTAFAYANPTRRVLANVLHTQSEVRVLAGEGGGLIDDAGGAPEDPGELNGELEPAIEARREAGGAPHLGYHSDVVEVFETFGYRPVLRVVMAVVAVAKRLQSGRLDAYMLYMLIALIAVVAVVTAMA